MQRILILSLIILGITKGLTAQTTITGVVTDSLNNPVPYASVYLNNTTMGVYTDNQGVYLLTVQNEGVYEMIITCIGYKTNSRIINTNSPKLIINIKLQVNPVILDEIIVNANRKRYRNYTMFNILFLGSSPNARYCKINNMKDLRLYGDEKGNITAGYSVQPLEIENKALGYKIIYDLQDFSYDKDSRTVKFAGTQYFEPMIGSQKKIARWQENRDATFEGSIMHFLRTLYTDSAALNGFNISACRDKADLSECTSGIPIDEKMIEVESRNNHKLIYYSTPLSVVYPKPYISKVNNKLTITTVNETSAILFLDTVSIYNSGYFNNPYAITWSGKMGKERIADMLPLDFMPAIQKKIDPKSINTIDTRILHPYENYFSTPREQVYTHFNKSSYLPGDEIWFTNYIVDQTKGLPSKTTRILYIDLYDPAGKLQEQKILNVNDGVASNSFKLSQANIPGRYTFRAYTNWMKNFNSPDECSTFFEVLGSTEKDSLMKNPAYDVQFLPESGTFLEGVLNRVGVKALDPNGKGIALKGEIFNERNQVKETFELNKLGMGAFTITPNPNEIYKAKVYLPDGRELMIDLPKTEEKGVIIKVNERFRDKVAVEITSNSSTIESENMYYFLLHNEGEVLKAGTLFFEIAKPWVDFSINTRDLANGTNCITIFNKDFQPIAEKLFFKLKEPILGKIDIQQKLINDTIEFTIYSKDSLDNAISARMSMSVLPEGTISDNFNHSLYSETLFKAGLRGTIENPDYYFESNDYEHSRALDLLFLTQGWRKYNWENIRYDTLKQPNSFETAFYLEGRVNNGKLDEVVSVISPENKLLLVKKADSDGKFNFPLLWLNDNSTIVVSASEENTGKARRINLEAAIKPAHTVDSLIGSTTFKFSDESEISNDAPPKLLQDEILLDEVVVVEKAKKNVFDGSIYKPFFEKVYTITKENYNRHASFESILLFEFGVNIQKDENGQTSINMNSGRTSGDPSLIIDDFNYKTDYFYLNFLDRTIVESISIMKEGNALTGPGGAILVKTRKEPIQWDYIKPDNIQFLKVKGYAAPVSYYTPRYLYPANTELFQKYATIYWKPDIITDKNGQASFRFPIPSGVKGLKVRTEGFSDMGIIFNDKRLIQLESNR